MRLSELRAAEKRIGDCIAQIEYAAFRRYGFKVADAVLMENEEYIELCEERSGLLSKIHELTNWGRTIPIPRNLTW